MEEKMEELYNEYLKEKLDIIFNSGTGETFNTKICESIRNIDYKTYYPYLTHYYNFSRYTVYSCKSL